MYLFRIMGVQLKEKGAIWIVVAPDLVDAIAIVGHGNLVIGECIGQAAPMFQMPKILCVGMRPEKEET